MSVRMRHTRAHTRNRRSHHALSEPRLSACAECGKDHVRHQMCPHCGTYRGRKVVDVAAVTARQEARRKAKLKAMGQPTSGTTDTKEKDTETSGALDAAALSQKGS